MNAILNLNYASKNEKVILNLKKCILRTWPEDCFLLSMIQNNSTGYDWIMNSFVQINAYQPENDLSPVRINFYPSGKHHFKVNIYDFCPFISKYAISHNLIKNASGKFSDFLIYAIDNNYYVSTFLDQFYRENNSKGFYHPNYIWGYDIKKQVFYLADNFNKGKYSFIEVTFSDINESYMLINKNPKQFYHSITYLYRLEDYSYKFDLKLLTDLLKDYLLSCNNLTYNFSQARMRNFGLSCYDLIQHYLSNVKANLGLIIDEKSFVFLIDHKHLMILRVRYLIEKGYLSNCDLLISELESLEASSKIILNLCLKYNVTKNSKIIDKILRLLQNLKSRDKKTIELLVEKLEKKR